ncbi:MAG TPA: hypothetical protein VF815_18515 [Myxococcaceae bacterium]|jgi:hypothetical protein
MRHVRHLCLVLSLLAAGCRYPEDPIFAYGRVLQANGEPLAGATLTVERAPQPIRDFFEEEEEEPEGPPPYAPYGTATTQANGEFTHEFLAGDVEESADDGSFYVQHRFRLALPLEDGRGTFVSFIFNDGDVELPTLQPWEDRFTVSQEAAGPTLSFAPAPPPAEVPPSGKNRLLILGPEGDVEIDVLPTVPEPIVQLFSGGERLWLQQGVNSPWSPSPYVLEDFASPEAQLRAVSMGTWLFSPLGSASSAVDFRQEWRTPRLPVSAGALRPVSRGASCEPSPPGACPWTDGQLAPVKFFSGDLDDAPYSLVITLAEPTRLSRAVIRGLEHGHVFTGTERLQLEGSADGASWFPLADLVLRTRDLQQSAIDSMNAAFAHSTSWDSPFDGELEQYEQLPVFLDVPLQSADPVRHLRLQVHAQSEDVSGRRILFSLAEVSLFE